MFLFLFAEEEVAKMVLACFPFSCQAMVILHAARGFLHTPSKSDQTEEQAHSAARFAGCRGTDFYQSLRLLVLGRSQSPEKWRDMSLPGMNECKFTLSRGVE